MPDPVTGTIVAVGTLTSAAIAKNAADTAEDTANAQLAWEEEVYQREQDSWANTYGSVEQNLSNYYNTLSADSYAVSGLENFQQEQETALTAAREALAQRGLSTSGAAAYTEIASATNQATTRAGIRSTAAENVAAQQQSFLSLGNGNEPSTSGISNVLASQASNAANASYQADAQLNSALSNVGYLAATSGTSSGYTGLSSSATQNYNSTYSTDNYLVPGSTSSGSYFNTGV